MQEVLTDYGWVFKAATSCCGPLRHSYRSEQFKGLELVLFPRNNAFKIIYKGGSPKTSVQRVEKLRLTCETIKNEYEAT